DDFDGIISGAPALDVSGLAGIFFTWVVQANTGPDGQDILPRANVKLALDVSAQSGICYSWVVQANTGPDGKDILPRAKVKLVQEAVLRACDAKDGREDGLIDDPRACDFKPVSLKCQKAGSA